jgi:hypothetical protein
MRLARLAVLALGIGSTPATAQTDSASATLRSTRVLAHAFTSPSREFVRVRLGADESYWAQLSRAGVRLEIRAVSQGVQAPRIREIFVGEKLRVFLIEPRVSSEYELRVLGGGDRPVRLLIDRRPPKP